MSSPCMFENLKEHLKLLRIKSKASPCMRMIFSIKWFFFYSHLKIKIYESFARDSEKDYKTEHSSEEKSEQFEPRSNSCEL